MSLSPNGPHGIGDGTVCSVALEFLDQIAASLQSVPTSYRGAEFDVVWPQEYFESQSHIRCDLAPDFALLSVSVKSLKRPTHLYSLTFSHS